MIGAIKRWPFAVGLLASAAAHAQSGSDHVHLPRHWHWLDDHHWLDDDDDDRDAAWDSRSSSQLGPNDYLSIAGYTGMEAGAQLSITLVSASGHDELAFDQMFGGGASGATTGERVSTTFLWGTALRFGRRVVYHDVALAAGAGIGGAIVFAYSDKPESPDPDGKLLIPVWASLLYKPVCNWGVQVMGTYEVHPTSIAENAPMLSVGVTWSPSTSCSKAPDVDEALQRAAQLALSWLTGSRPDGAAPCTG